MSESDLPIDRATELECHVAHLQRAYDHLNEVVIEQANLIDRMQRRITKLESRVSELKQHADVSTNPLDEKPPHY